MKYQARMQASEDRQLFLVNRTLLLLGAARFCSSNTPTSPLLSPTSRQSVLLAKSTDVNFTLGLAKQEITGFKLQPSRGKN